MNISFTKFTTRKIDEDHYVIKNEMLINNDKYNVDFIYHQCSDVIYLNDPSCHDFIRILWDVPEKNYNNLSEKICNSSFYIIKQYCVSIKNRWDLKKILNAQKNNWGNAREFINNIYL